MVDSGSSMAPVDASPARHEGKPVSLGTAAPLLFVALWSTGFVGAKYGLPDAEPFTFLLIRLSCAAVLLGLIALATRAPWPSSPAAWRHAAVAGLLLHGGYLGGVFYAVDHGVPAGIAAVIVSMQPVITSALVPRLLGDVVGPRAWLGLVLGLLGVALVVVPDALGSATGALPAAGVVACLVALASTTGGTLYQKRHGPGVPLLSGAAAQYAATSVVLLALAATTESMDVRWTGAFVASLAWLILALSVGAVLLLLTLLRRGSAVRVSSLFYLVPPATALEAYVLLGERLSAVQLVGMLLAVGGVAIVMTAPAGARPG
jgi:drug/metabolite transporter (DMT)-like permease